MTSETFKPRVRPRNLTDAVLALSVAVLQALVLYALPAIIGFSLTRSIDVAFFSAAAAALAVVSFSVKELVADSAGIRLSRLVGSPKFVPWGSITSIQEAPRSELIWRGWLWPLFPSREMTFSLTSIGHYRIQFGSRSVYFPPLEPEAFQATVLRRLGERA